MASYSAVIDLRVNGLQNLKTVEDRVKAIQNIQQQLKPVPTLFDKRASAELKAAKEELSKYVIQAGKGDTNTAKFSSTMAGLSAQVRAFNTVAANANATSEEFAHALNASERASIKLKKAELERLNVLNKFYTPKAVGGSVNVKEILDLGKIIPKSVSGLEFYQRELQETLRIVDIGSKDFIDLSLAIAEVNEQLARVGSAGGIQGPKLAKGGFPSSPIGGISRGSGGRSRTQDILTGFGFPLLFGGSPAQALAGGIGGAVGGLGGSIISSAVVSQLEGFAVSVAETGQALNALTGDLSEVTTAAGLTGSALERQLQAAEEVLGKEQALIFARELLAQKIGRDAVAALESAGDEFTELGNNINILGTKIAAFVAGPLAAFLSAINDSLSSPQAQRIQTLDIAKQQFRAGTASPEITALFEERGSLEGSYEERAKRRLEIDREIVKIVREQNTEYQKNIKLAVDAAHASELKKLQEETSLIISRNRLIVARNENNLLLESVQIARRAIIAEETRLALKEANKNVTLIEIALNEAAAKKAALDKAIQDAKNKAAKLAAKGTKSQESAAKKEAQIQKSLAAEKLKQFDIDTRLSAIILGRQEKAKYELSRLRERTQLQENIIRLDEQDARLQKAKLDTLEQQADLRREELKATIDQLAFEKELQALRSRQETAGIALGLGQELTKLQLPTGNAFNDERTALLTEQANRYVNTLMAVNNELAIQQKILEDPRSSEDAKVAAEARNKTLQDQKAIYEEMLPAIAAAEREQLAYNQALSLVQGPVNSLVSGLQAVIDGTKTAEEAFADFLRTIADQLMQAATQMIAQYIALGIARIFAFGGGGGGTSFMTGVNNPLNVSSPAGFNLNGFGAFQRRANGGPVSGGTPYIVGERGPELFVPRASGTIVSNDKMGGGVTVGSINISVENSGDSLSPAAQKQIAGQVQGIVLSTLANERRSGGML